MFLTHKTMPVTFIKTMIRKAEKRDIPSIIELLHQVDMVHHMIRPDLFKPNTTKYNEQELEDLLGNDSKPIFVYDNGEVLGHAFCMITEVKEDKFLVHTFIEYASFH